MAYRYFNRNGFRILVLGMVLFCGGHVSSQSKADSLPDNLRAKILNNFMHFTFDLYVDAYYNWTFGGNTDTSNLVPYSGNCPVHDQIRLNVAALQVVYSDDRVRGKLQLQYGDAPNLLASPDAQWIKNIRQAFFGFRIVKDLWIDAGYQFTPVGCESGWPVSNRISTVSFCGYFEPGAVLGVKVSYKVSSQFDVGLMFGNTYSLAYAKNTHLGGLLFINYYPVPTVHIAYSNLFGNQALANATIKNNILYNDLLVTYDPNKHISLVGQFDFAGQTNSALPPDTNHIATMVSGFLEAQYKFNPHFSLAARYQYFDDPNGFLSGTYTYDDKITGLATQGFSLSFEYRPVNIGYVRLEYRYLQANKGNDVFYSKTSDSMQGMVLTTGVFF